MPASPALRRYNKRALLSCAAYAFALVGGISYFKNHPGAHGPAAYVAAIVPALAIIGVFVAMGRYLIEEQDEYLRLLTTRQVLIATAFALSAATLWGFLTSFGLAPHIDSYYIAVVWFGGLGLGSCVNRLIERRGA